MFWQEDKLKFGGADGFGGIWGFSESLKPGVYRIRIRYENQSETAKVAVKKDDEDPIRHGFWRGAVDTPFVNVSIVEPGTRTVIKRSDEPVGREVSIKDSK